MFGFHNSLNGGLYNVNAAILILKLVVVAEIIIFTISSLIWCSFHLWIVLDRKVNRLNLELEKSLNTSFKRKSSFNYFKELFLVYSRKRSVTSPNDSTQSSFDRMARNRIELGSPVHINTSCYMGYISTQPVTVDSTGTDAYQITPVSTILLERG